MMSPPFAIPAATTYAHRDESIAAAELCLAIDALVNPRSSSPEAADPFDECRPIDGRCVRKRTEHDAALVSVSVIARHGRDRGAQTSEIVHRELLPLRCFHQNVL